MRKRWLTEAAAVALLLALGAGGCGSQPGQPGSAGSRAAGGAAPIYKDPKAPVAQRVADLLGQMTLDEKIGQMTQVERLALKPAKEIAAFNLGSVFSGGGSAPEPNEPKAWADMYDGYQKQALSTRLAIPLLYGIDAVHGHNTVRGATVFPHNIGLGATRNPDLVRRVGEITALEMAGTGIRWNFGPCLAVARNERWGRTYESFGEDPELVRAMTSIITGLQGSDLSQPTSVLATAKHFVADGGTVGGKDQGDAKLSEADLRAVHLAPYVDAIQKGARSIMVSFSSLNGTKMHGNRHLVTDILKGELGFTGFVVSDYQGVDQISGDYGQAVRTAINAGIDMVMVPNDYRRFQSTLKREVQAGQVDISRIDDAVRRILTVKFEMGLFEHPYADRTYTAAVGSAEHRAVAREAVRQSVVLLKNEGGILPLSRSLRSIYVAGKNANDIGNQSGGWTMTWQGQSGDITPGTTILKGIQEAVGKETRVVYDRSAATIDSSYAVAVVVIGETPYAEYEGDRPNGLGLDTADLDTLARVKRAGVPAVVVLVSGRPLVVTEHLKDWQAFLAAWLPGTEGGGIADVLFGDYPPTGKLPHSWPRSEAQIPVNLGDRSYDPLFPYGFGLTYR